MQNCSYFINYLQVLIKGHLPFACYEKNNTETRLYLQGQIAAKVPTHIASHIKPRLL